MLVNLCTLVVSCSSLYLGTFSRILLMYLGCLFTWNKIVISMIKKQMLVSMGQNYRHGLHYFLFDDFKVKTNCPLKQHE